MAFFCISDIFITHYYLVVDILSSMSKVSQTVQRRRLPYENPPVGKRLFLQPVVRPGSVRSSVWLALYLSMSWLAEKQIHSTRNNQADIQNLWYWPDRLLLPAGKRGDFLKAQRGCHDNNIVPDGTLLWVNMNSRFLVHTASGSQQKNNG